MFQQMRVFVEPGLAFPVIGHEGPKGAPEPGRMVLLLDVKQFVGHHVIYEGIPRHNELPVEGETIVRRAGAPLGSRSHESDPLGYQVESLAEIEHFFGDLFPGPCLIPLDEQLSCFYGVFLG